MKTANTLRTKVDMLLQEITTRRLLLTGPDPDVWPDTHVPAKIKRNVKRNRGYIQALMDVGDSRLCVNRSLHAPYFKHIGCGRYVCEKCLHFVKWGIC